MSASWFSSIMWPQQSLRSGPQPKPGPGDVWMLGWVSHLGCSSSWEQQQLIWLVRDGSAACCLCAHMGTVTGGASKVPELDALAFKAGVLDCALQSPQDSCFTQWKAGFLLFGYFSDVTKTIMCTNLLSSQFHCEFGWCYSFHFASEKINASLLKILSDACCILWGTESLRT